MPLFNIRMDVYHHIGDDTLSPLMELLTEIKMTQAELANKLNAVNEQLGKIVTEEKSLIEKIGVLTQAVEDAKNVDPGLASAAQAVADQAGVLDALVPDAVEPPVDPNA